MSHFLRPKFLDPQSECPMKYPRDQLYSTLAKFSGNLTPLTLIRTRTRIVSFPDNFAGVQNELF